MSDFDTSVNEPPAAAAPDAGAVEQLSLPEIEEAIGEIERRIAVALRALGERAADEPDAAGRSPRREVAELAADLELAALALAAIAGGGELPVEYGERRPALAAGLMYAAPTIPALLQRLDQDRRLLVSLARAAAERLGGEDADPQDQRALRRLLVESGLGAAARCAMACEAALARRAEAGEPEPEPEPEPPHGP